MKFKILQFYQEKPLTVIMATAIFFRLLAVIFSGGFAQYDDHYLVIEPTSGFVKGLDYNNWLPSSSEVPSGHNFFYPGIHYLIFLFFRLLGLEDPQSMMLLIRLLHGAYSLLVVWLGYRIGNLTGSIATAKLAAWMLALLWFVPNFSVRNLVEFVCIPPLLASAFFHLKYEREKNLKWILFSAIMAGLATGVRYQAVFFPLGAGLVFLFRRELKVFLMFGMITFITFFLTQSTDLFLWGKPFAELKEYFGYNAENATNYFTQPFYQYLPTIFGLLIPPLSILLGIGFVKSFKKLPLLTWPALLFLLFHSLFPNKQERFILPFLPFFVLAGLAGWQWMHQTKTWIKWKKISLSIFWIMNGIVLVPFSTYYGQKGIIEAMYYLYKQKGSMAFYMDCSAQGHFSWPPVFYSGKQTIAGYSFDEKKYTLAERVPEMVNSGRNFQHVLFLNSKNLEQRVKDFEKLSGKKLHLKFTGKPHYIEWILQWLNKHNKYHEIFVYEAV